MTVAFDKQRFKIYIRIGIALFFLMLFRDLATYPYDQFFKRAVNNFWLISYLIVLNFILYEYTLPFFKLSVKRIVLGILFLFILIMGYSYAFYGWRHILIELGLYFPLRVATSLKEGVTYHFSYAVFSIVFFGIVKHIYDYYKLKSATQQLRIEKQAAELNYLKSQTNPHFLFNTLNNIYSLARDKSELAPESILRLSKILRFMLYETGGDYIAIEQELKIITDYIELEKLRYDESLRINFNYDVEDMRQALPPLLLIPLVENAFKHGVSETRSQPYIDIHLTVNKRQLAFVVKNSSDRLQEDGTVKENIGLSNLRRQLELLYKDYNLTVRQSETAFTATLQINLASHV